MTSTAIYNPNGGVPFVIGQYGQQPQGAIFARMVNNNPIFNLNGDFVNSSGQAVDPTTGAVIAGGSSASPNPQPTVIDSSGDGLVTVTNPDGSKSITGPGGLNLNIPAFTPVPIGTATPPEGTTPLNSDTTPSALTSQFAPPLTVSAPPDTTAPQSGVGTEILWFALAAIIAGAIAYGAYMLYKHRAEIEADI